MLKKYSSLFVIAVLTLHSLLLNGYFYGYGFNYIPFGYNLPPIFFRLDPALYPLDMYIRSSIHHNTYFFNIIVFLTKYIAIEKAAFALSVTCLYITLLAIFYLTLVVFKNKTSGYLAILLYSFGLRQWSLGEPGIYCNFLDAAIIAYPVLMFALAFFLKKRYFVSLFLTGLIFNIHLPYALNLLFIFSCFFLWQYRLLNIRFIVKAVLSILIPALPFFRMLPSLLRPKYYSQEWFQAIQTGEWFHHLPSCWDLNHYVRFLLFAGLTAFSIYKIQNSDKRRTITALFSSLLLLCTLGTIFTEVFPTPFFIQLHVWNYGTWIFYLAAIACIAGLLVSQWNNNINRQFSIIAIVPVIAGYIQPYWIMPLLAVMLLSTSFKDNMCLRLKSFRTIAILVLTYLVFSAFLPELRIGMAYTGKFAALVLVCIFMFVISTSLLTKRFTAYAPGKKLLIASILFLVFFDLSYVYRQNGVNLNYKGYSKSNTPPWIDAQLYARDHTPKGALFIVPPYLEGFNVFSRRSIFGDWIIGTTCVWGDNSYASEWLNRMELLGWDTSRVMKNFQQVKHGYNSLTDKQIMKIAKQYSASYIVFEKTKKLDLPIEYKNSEFIIYRTESDNGSSNHFQYMINQRDRSKMVLIPAGEFLMGSENGDTDEKPLHKVPVNSFYMDIYETTNLQYCSFLNESRADLQKIAEWINLDSKLCAIRKTTDRFSVKSGHENFPVVCISWKGADSYARWAGKRLPTEAEWEYASRGGLKEKQYSWGIENPATGKWANYNCPSDGYEQLAPVGRFPVNNFGLHDMAGNAWEWCSDWYNSNFYTWSKSFDHWNIVLKGTFRVRRSGSWRSDANSLRNAYRSFGKPSSGGMDSGFRCCKNRQ